MRRSLYLSPDGDGSQAPKTYTQEQLDAEVKGLKEKRDELLGKVTKYGEQTKAFEGIDPEKARAALTALEKAEGERAKALGDWDANEKRLRALWADEHTKVVQPLTERATALEADLFDAVAVRDALDAMADSEVNAYPKLATPLIRHELGVEMVDGKRVTVIRGADGKPRYHPTTGKLVTPKERLLELKTIPDYAGAFKGSGGSGGGAERGTAVSAAGTITLTPEQAQDHQTYQTALKSVGGDYAKVVVK